MTGEGPLDQLAVVGLGEGFEARGEISAGLALVGDEVVDDDTEGDERVRPSGYRRQLRTEAPQIGALDLMVLEAAQHVLEVLQRAYQWLDLRRRPHATEQFQEIPQL